MTDDPARLRILNDLALSIAENVVSTTPSAIQNPLDFPNADPSAASLSIITAASIAVLYISEFESGCGTAERGTATIGEPVTIKLCVPAASPSVRASMFHSPDGLESASNMVQ